MVFCNPRKRNLPNFWSVPGACSENTINCPAKMIIKSGALLDWVPGEPLGHPKEPLRTPKEAPKDPGGRPKAPPGPTKGCKNRKIVRQKVTRTTVTREARNAPATQNVKIARWRVMRVSAIG